MSLTWSQAPKTGFLLTGLISKMYLFQPRMDQYFTQMTKIVNEKKTSSRVRFMLQDVIDLRKVSKIYFPLLAV